MTPAPLLRRLAVAAVLGAGAACAQAAPAVDIAFSLDAAHRLSVRYRAPEGVSHLDFMLHDPRIDRLFRTPMLRPVDDCATLVPGGIDLRRGKGCGAGAQFVVQPAVVSRQAFSEPAEPSSDGGVLFYTGYYAAAARGVDLRWQFVAGPGDYVVDDGRRQAGVVTVAPATPGAGVQRDSEAWLRQMHALNYVFIGHSPTESEGGLLWVRDPALPAAAVEAVANAGRIAWRAYGEAAQAMPPGPAAIVMLRAAQAAEGFRDYHGDRTEGNMLRLTFIDPPADPPAAQLEAWAGFVAHEMAHLWNAGVFGTDFDEPWLHEGDAEWVGLNALHEARVLSDAGFVKRLDAAVNTCLVVRGDAPAKSFPKQWHDGRDDPYACGVALQLLGWAERRKRDPSAIATPLERWGELHRRVPEMTSTAFAGFFDEGGAPMMRELLLGEATPFASTYRKDLANFVPVQTLAGEYADAALREQVARRLFAQLEQADCSGGLGFTTYAQTGEMVVDDRLGCRAIPAGAHVVALAGVKALAQPRAAWIAVRQACAGAKHYALGVANAAPVDVDCPADLPAPPTPIRLPADVLRWLQLMPLPVRADAPPAR